MIRIESLSMQKTGSKKKSKNLKMLNRSIRELINHKESRGKQSCFPFFWFLLSCTFLHIRGLIIEYVKKFLKRVNIRVKSRGYHKFGTNKSFKCRKIPLPGC